MLIKILISLASFYAISTFATETNHPETPETGTHAMHAHQDHKPYSQAGMPMPGAPADRNITVSLTDDMKILFETPADIYQDEVVRFIVTNKGNKRHEFSISSLGERKAHVEMMRKMPGMKHDNDHTITLESGETGELTWHFSGQSRVIFACNMPGHSEAGMLQMALLKTLEHMPGHQMSNGAHDH
jgi:uncharacterized cupredoxin-like copper-binding protein